MLPTLASGMGSEREECSRRKPVQIIREFFIMADSAATGFYSPPAVLLDVDHEADLIKAKPKPVPGPEPETPPRVRHL